MIVSTWLGLAAAGGWGSGLAIADTTESDAQSSESADTSDQEASTSTPEADPEPDPETQEQEAEDEAPAEPEIDESEAPEIDSESDADDAEPAERPDRSNHKGTTAGESAVTVSTAQRAAESESDDDAGAKAGSPATAETVVTTEESTTEPPPAAVDTVVVATPEAVSEPAPAPPVSTATRGIADVIASVLQPFSATGDLPGEPVGTPAAWALLGFARREIGAEATLPEQYQVAAQQVSTSLTVDATTTAIPDNWEDQYTGQPSLVHQLVVVGLKIVDVVLKPFGGLLSFTSLKIPLFTDGIPPFFFRHGLNVERTEFEGMRVWTLEPKNPSGEYIVALHGGAYVATASLFHWWTYTDMARETGATVIVPLYRLVPDGGTAGEAVPKTARFLEKVMADHGADNVSVIGDSAGGGLALAAVQELVGRGSTVPSRMVLFAPWLDVSMSDPLSTELDAGDPLLDVANPREAGEDWGGELGATHPYASPLFGSLEGLPPITVYSESLDLVTPDTLRLQQLVAAGGYSNFTFNLRKDLLHDWFIFGFLPDAHAIRPSVYAALLGD